jgi:hypothetical protein
MLVDTLQQDSPGRVTKSTLLYIYMEMLAE